MKVAKSNVHSTGSAAYPGFCSFIIVFTPDCLVRSVLLIFLVSLFVLLCVFTFCIRCCVICYDFQMKTTFGSSSLLVVCKRLKAHVLFTLFVICVYLLIVVSNTYYVVFFVLFFSVLFDLCDQFLWIVHS